MRTPWYALSVALLELTACGTDTLVSTEAGAGSTTSGVSLESAARPSGPGGILTSGDGAAPHQPQSWRDASRRRPHGGSSSGSTGSTGTSSSSTSSSGSTSASSTGSTSGSTASGTTGSTGAGPTVGGCPLFPAGNMWNTDISQYPVHARSAQWVAALNPSTGVHPDFGTVWNGAPIGIPFVIVDANQPRLPVTFDYATESDPGPYPVPLSAPIEGGASSNGDRHVIVLDSSSCTVYELYDAHPLAASWHAGSGAVWHLGQNEQRPDGWTSADAAGLAILPGLVRYDEVAAGEVRHAIRFTGAMLQSAYVHPATHSDGQAGYDPTHPPMGARFRLKASFDVSGFPPEVRVILNAMKKYGLVLADTGTDWEIGGVPDPRWSDDNLHTLTQVAGSNFEAVESGPVISY